MYIGIPHPPSTPHSPSTSHSPSHSTPTSPILVSLSINAIMAVCELVGRMGPGRCLASFLPGLASSLGRYEGGMHCKIVDYDLADWTIIPHPIPFNSLILIYSSLFSTTLLSPLIVLIRVIVGDYKQGHAVVGAALGTWGAAVSTALADSQLPAVHVRDIWAAVEAAASTSSSKAVKVRQELWPWDGRMHRDAAV